jgi:hypothetical protein
MNNELNLMTHKTGGRAGESPVSVLGNSTWSLHRTENKVYFAHQEIS